MELNEQPYLDQISKLEELKEPANIEITPEIGEIVHWFDGGQVGEDNRCAAIVTRIERPGVITVEVFRPMAGKLHKSSVRWDGTVKDVDRNSEMIRQNGTFRLRPSEKVLQRHKRPHLDYVEDRIDAINTELERYRKSVQRLQQQEPEEATEA